MRTNRMTRRWIVAATIAFAVGAPTLAHEGHHHNAMGTVRAVDAAQLQLETKDSKLEIFVLTDATTYKRGDAAAKREDVAVGARAVVMYESKDGKNVAIEVKLAATGHEGHEGHGASMSPMTAPQSGATLTADEDGALRQVEPRFVCMVNNSLFDRPQIPVEVGGKTYFGCCPMCKERLATDAEARQAMDPVSGRVVDKAVAVIGVLPTGAVVYFESEANLAAHRAMLAGRQPS
jgi:YHS domain-containing protein